MDLDYIMLSRIRQSQKVMGHMFSLICRSLGVTGIPEELQIMEEKLQGSQGGGLGEGRENQ